MSWGGLILFEELSLFCDALGASREKIWYGKSPKHFSPVRCRTQEISPASKNFVLAAAAAYDNSRVMAQ